MTPVGHYASSSLIGLLAARITGIPLVGGMAAFAVHVPLDYAFNEFYAWGEGWSKKILMTVFLSSAVLLLAGTTALSSSWFAMMVFGLIGCLPDVFDAVTSRTIGRRFLHFNTPAQMQSFTGTIITETSFALLALLIVLGFKV